MDPIILGRTVDFFFCPIFCHISAYFESIISCSQSSLSNFLFSQAMASSRSNFYHCCLLICAVMLQQVNGFMSTNVPRLRRASALFAAKKYCVNVNLYVKPERREEFLRVIRINAQGTRSQVHLPCFATSTSKRSYSTL